MLILTHSGVATGGAGRGSSPPIHSANGSMLHAAKIVQGAAYLQLLQTIIYYKK